MRSIQVSANKESFQTVSFTPNGFIVAKQTDPMSDKKNSANGGVGSHSLLEYSFFNVVILKAQQYGGGGGQPWTPNKFK